MTPKKRSYIVTYLESYSQVYNISIVFTDSKCNIIDVDDNMDNFINLANKYFDSLENDNIDTKDKILQEVNDNKDNILQEVNDKKDNILEKENDNKNNILQEVNDYLQDVNGNKSEIFYLVNDNKNINLQELSDNKDDKYSSIRREILSFVENSDEKECTDGWNYQHSVVFGSTVIWTQIRTPAFI